MPDPTFEAEVPAAPAAFSREVQAALGPAFRIDEFLLEAYLEQLLAFACRIEVLDDYEQDRVAQTVSLEIPAVVCTFSYYDAASFLCSLILEALRPPSHAA